MANLDDRSSDAFSKTLLVADFLEEGGRTYENNLGTQGANLEDRPYSWKLEYSFGFYESRLMVTYRIFVRVC